MKLVGDKVRTHLRQDGFIGQRMTYVPGFVNKKVLVDPQIQDLYITHIGIFPKATGHFRERPNGCLQFIFIYCVEGEGWIEIEHKRFQIAKNQLFVIRPKLACSYGASEKNPWSIYWLHFTGENAGLYSPLSNQIINIPSDRNSRIDERLIIFEEILQNIEDHFNFEKVLYANISLKHFLASVKYLPVYRSVNKDISFNKLGKAISLMKSNLNKRITLRDIAITCNCSEANVSKIFRESLKSAPIDYFIHLKIQEACKILLNTDLRIKEISLKLGYEDQYYFSRIFTKHVGLSPSLYRKEEK
jgi:AraC family transcriptional regulator of arabinose operon